MHKILTSEMNKMLADLEQTMKLAKSQLNVELAKLPKAQQDALKPLIDKVQDTTQKDTSAPMQPLNDIIKIINGNYNK